MTFTVSLWMELQFKSDPKPSLHMIQIREGKERSPNVKWAKVVEADDSKKAYEIAMALLKAGDPGDDLSSIPVYQPKQNPPVEVPSKLTKKKGKEAA